MTPVDGSEIVEATWTGPFIGETTDGLRLVPGDPVEIPAAQAILSGHFETDVELVQPTELPGPEVPLNEELLNGYKLEQLDEIAQARDIDPTKIQGKGAGGRVLKSDVIAAILEAQSAAPSGAGGDSGGGE
jgi:pyruvate/2-oxoglutarate dehydrogenase complex dihydrolipoamide acyltransferase (E2) component